MKSAPGIHAPPKSNDTKWWQHQPFKTISLARRETGGAVIRTGNISHKPKYVVTWCPGGGAILSSYGPFGQWGLETVWHEPLRVTGHLCFQPEHSSSPQATLQALVAMGEDPTPWLSIFSRRRTPQTVSQDELTQSLLLGNLLIAMRAQTGKMGGRRKKKLNFQESHFSFALVPINHTVQHCNANH